MRTATMRPSFMWILIGAVIIILGIWLCVSTIRALKPAQQSQFSPNAESNVLPETDSPRYGTYEEGYSFNY
jgi:ABC-type nickel/cobalt efflux system permease component RcnA